MHSILQPDTRKTRIVIAIVAVFYVTVATFFIVGTWYQDYIQNIATEVVLREKVLASMQIQFNQLEQQVRSKADELISVVLDPSLQLSVAGVRKQFFDLHTTILFELGQLVSATSPADIESFAIRSRNLNQDSSLLNNTLLLTKYAQELHRPFRVKISQLARSHAKKIQKQLLLHQHPSNCFGRKQLLCDINQSCGFGCQIHHVVGCLIAAVALDRILIIKSNPWSYSDNGWETYFEPVTNCTLVEPDVDKIPTFTDVQASLDHAAIKYPFLLSPSSLPDWLPFAFPKRLAHQIPLFHGDPGLWWIAQNLKYLWRLRPDVSELLSDHGFRLRLQKPYVGIHIRRTDKVRTEAKLFAVQEYMEKVDAYFNRKIFWEGNRTVKSRRRLYVASDQATLIGEIQSRYNKSYEVHGRDIQAKQAGSGMNQPDPSLLNVISDISFLAHSDHIVCTFSSNICRVAYALMQVKEDKSNAFDSLDDQYWFQGANQRPFRALYDHASDKTNDLNFKKGDRIIGVENLWSGQSSGRNEKTGQTGNFPTFKITEIPTEVHIPLAEETARKPAIILLFQMSL